MGAKNILRVHDSIGKCFENDLCKLCGCNFWSQSVGDEMRLKQQLAFFVSKILARLTVQCHKKGPHYATKKDLTMSQPWGVVSCSHLL